MIKKGPEYVEMLNILFYLHLKVLKFGKFDEL